MVRAQPVPQAYPLPGATAVEIRQIVVQCQEIRSEGGRALSTPTLRAAACAVLHNPYAGGVPLDDFTPLVERSAEVGELLTTRALALLAGQPVRGYGKAALVGTAGDLEHGASMIHVRLGLSMRRGAGGGPALIPGNAKVGPAGSPIDLIFGGLEDAWDYDAMDSMTLRIEDAPRPDEILLAVAFLSGTRPNARIAGASQAQVADAVRKPRGRS
jgi:hypothetical protein